MPHSTPHDSSDTERDRHLRCVCALPGLPTGPPDAPQHDDVSTLTKNVVHDVPSPHINVCACIAEHGGWGTCVQGLDTSTATGQQHRRPAE